MLIHIQAQKMNLYPLVGMLINSPNPRDWLSGLQQLQISLEKVDCYVLPNTTPNSIWGCLVLTRNRQALPEIGKNEACQWVDGGLFIPAYTELFPQVTPKELRTFLLDKPYFLHPEVGMVDLEEHLIDWGTFLNELPAKEVEVSYPAPPIFIPENVKSFQVQALSPEEELNQFLDSIPKDTMDKNPLSLIEKGRLAFYRKLFGKEVGEIKDGEEIPPSTLMKMIEALYPNNPEKVQEMLKDYQELEERNKKEVDRLLGMLKKNPLEALKYAIPLDQKGFNRGGDAGAFQLSKMRNDFSFGSNSWRGGGGGGSVDLGEGYYALQAQYTQTAEQLICEEKYKEAAFVYHKLLGNHYLAAQTLEKGEMYSEAASIYLKHCKNKSAAALCYEKGHHYEKAIELHIELNNSEKVGDLYLQINEIEKAQAYYEETVAKYREKHQYIKASLIYRKKMDQPEKAQALLKEGWLGYHDPFNCINNYFANIATTKQLGEEIAQIYQEEVNHDNSYTFLSAMKYEYAKENELQNQIRAIAYEIIAERAIKTPKVVGELEHFNPKDRELNKDVIRFKNKN